MDIGGYLEDIRAKYVSGQATEHSYRPALQKLFASIDPALTVINEPKKSEAGMPDFLFRRGDIPFLHASTTNIGAIRLYESLGFTIRRPVVFLLLEAPG